MIEKKIIFVILISLLILPIANADSGQGTFIWSEGVSDSYYSTITTGYSTASPNRLVFNNIDYFDEVYQVKAFYNSTDYTGGPKTGPGSAWTYFNVVGQNISGDIGYFKSELDGEVGVWLILDITQWDKGSLTGEQNLELNFTESDIYSFRPTETASIPAGDEYYGFYSSAGAVTTTYIGNPYRISYSTNFVNTYDYHNETAVKYYINVTKTYEGKPYQSKWNVSTPELNYINETAFNNDSFRLFTLETPIYLECRDLYDNEYSTTIYGPDVGDYAIKGTVIDAELSSVVDNTSIQVSGDSTGSDSSDESGYFEISGLVNGVYSINATHSDYIPYTSNFTILNSNISYNIPLFKEGYDSDGNRDSTVPFIAGVVKNSTNYNPLQNAYVILYNNSTQYAQYTNENGYFGIYPDINGTYTVLVQKQDYYSYQKEVNISGATSEIILMTYISEIAIDDEEEEPENIRETFVSFLEDFGFSSEWVKIIISIAIILGSGYIGTLFTKKDNPIIVVVSMFFGFIASVALSLLSPMFLVIVIVVIVMSILYLKE